MSDQDFSFTSDGFLVKYTDEEIEINNLALFRAELDLDWVIGPLKLNFELWYSDVEGTPELISEKEIRFTS